MKVLVLGATGATGREVVRAALALKLDVTAFVRTPARFAISDPKLKIAEGDVGDYAAVSRAVAGQDAIISTLGVGKPLKSDPVVIDGIRNLLRAMGEHSVRRLIYLSFIGVSESRADAGLIVRYIARLPLRHEIADHEIKEDLIRRSSVDWTIVRAPKLSNGPATGRYRVGDTIRAQSLFPIISRADLASFLVEQLSDSAWIRKAPRILP